MNQRTMKYLLLILVLFVMRVEPIKWLELPKNYKRAPVLRTERISQRNPGDKAYMVYLRPASFSENLTPLTEWVCGGVIIHKLYILTSAACIENVTHFLVISGTHEWIPPDVDENKCIMNGGKKAVWKGTPKGNFNNGGKAGNVRWIEGDLAVVKVEDEFNFERKIRGCDFIPRKIDINKFGKDYEKSGTSASIVGWGSTKRYTNIYMNSIQHPVNLFETNVVVITRRSCKEYWKGRYSNDISDDVICTEDIEDADDECTDGKCKKRAHSKEDNFDSNTDQKKERKNAGISVAHGLVQNDVVRGGPNGEFCKDDHGGPLLVGQGKNAIVTGIMSACFTKNTTNKCSSPFFFTSVYKHQDFITACGLEDVSGSDCRKLMKSKRYIETFYNWTEHPEGPAISEISNYINHRIYVQTPREPHWPQSATSKYTSLEEHLTSEKQKHISADEITTSNKPEHISSEEFTTSKKQKHFSSEEFTTSKKQKHFTSEEFTTSKNQKHFSIEEFTISEKPTYITSKEITTSLKPFNRHRFIIFTNGLTKFNQSSSSYLEKKLSTTRHDKNLEITTSKKSNEINMDPLRSEQSKSDNLKHTTEYDLMMQLFGPYTTNDDTYLPKPYINTRKFGRDTLKSKNHSLNFVKHNVKSDTNKPKQIISTIKGDLYSPNEDIKTSKSHIHKPKQATSTSKSQKFTRTYDISTSQSHEYSPKSQISTSIFQNYTPKSHISTSIFHIYSPKFHKFTPEKDPLDSKKKDLLTVELWNLQNIRLNPEFRTRHLNNRNFVNKSIYLKSARQIENVRG